MNVEVTGNLNKNNSGGVMEKSLIEIGTKCMAREELKIVSIKNSEELHCKGKRNGALDVWGSKIQEFFF